MTFKLIAIVGLLCALPLLAAAIERCDGEIAPETPVDLKAIVGDANVTLTWTAANKACLDFYRLRYIQQGPTGERTTKPIERQTRETNITLTEGISNGILHGFSVEAVKGGFNRTKPASVSAVPLRACDASASPNAALEVVAYSEGANIKLCWKPPVTGGCVDEYRVAARIVPLTQEEARSVRWNYQTHATAGCITFKGLQDRRSYQFAVQTYSKAARSGSAVGASATVVSNWRCMPGKMISTLEFLLP
jgi:hypothetical protein